MLDETGAMAQELAQVQGDLQKAWKERDAALAQMNTMKTALAEKCGAKAAAVASDKAKLAAATLAEENAKRLVKADQDAARAEAQKANTAMATAREAVTEKEKAKASLADATKQVQLAEANVKTVTAQSSSARDEAKKLAESGGTDDEVKAGYAKASSAYAAVMDSKMRLEMAKKRVDELTGNADAASAKAKKELLGAKDYTHDAAGKVKAAMKAQVAAAKEKREVAEKQAQVVREQESELLKESNTLKDRIENAKANSKKAHDALEEAKVNESRALEAVKLPSGASPAEKKAFEEAKWKVMSDQQGGTANYAAKIKNIETKLLDAKEKVRHAKEQMEESKNKQNTLMSKMAAETDNVLKAKMDKEIKGLTGAIKQHQTVIDTATVDMKKIDAEQKEQIKEVVQGVVLSEGGATTAAENEGAAAAAQKQLNKPNAL